jgi:hypothetical protein
MDETQFCCKAYEKMAQTFVWFSYVNDRGTKTFCMPSIKVGEIFLRINHCPSCGKPTRSIEVPEYEYQRIMLGESDE